MDVNAVPANRCIPLSRGELFKEVVHKRVYGDISQLWHFPGHIIITSDEGKKLFTFDCKPISQQHVFEDRCLDISNVTTPLVDVVMLTRDMLALIDTGGLVNFWKFTQDFRWSHSGSTRICTSENAEVISVAYLPGCGSLFWCEKQHNSSISTSSDPSSLSPIYCVCKRQLVSDADHGKFKEHSLSSVIIHNCPSCDVLAMATDVLFITTQYNADQVMVTMLLDYTLDQLSLFIGDDCTEFSITSDKTLNFQDAVMSCLEVLMKSEPGHGDLGVTSDFVHNQVAVLSSSGQVEIYSCMSDSGKPSISRKSLKLPLDLNRAIHLNKRHWFLHQKHLGILCNNNVHIFCLKEGLQVYGSQLEALNSIETVIFPSSSPAFLAWALTSNQLFAIQGFATKNKELYTSPDKLPDDHLLQTDSLKLAHLQQLKISGYNQKAIKDLGELRENWEETKNMSQHSKISSIIAPYVEEYWRLESLSKVLLDSGRPMVTGDSNSAENMVRSLMERRNLSRTDRHSKLVWLSQVYPQELLDYLCQGISIDCVDVPQNEMRKWQSLLGLDGGDYINFEFVCRLLFQLHPDKLLNYVRCAESVCERTVGVSAFVRKKHSLIYYKTACECLPESHMSCDLKTAASVKAKLLLASEGDNCVERALKYLLQHELWSEAVKLVKSQVKNEEGMPALLHITITALAQGQVLSDYIADVFEIMPSWKSFVSFSQVAAERPEIRHQQLSLSAKDVFAEGHPDVKLGSVKEFLLNMVKKMDS